MNVVIYARYSSNKQDENTIEAQLRYCHEYCEKHNYIVVNEYIDRATSASTNIEKRTQFLQMIKDSDKKTFNSVIVFKLDRFARNRYDSATYKNKLKKNGVTVISATENLSGDKESIILESVLEGMAEYFSKDLSEKVTSGMREIALKCEYNGGVVPIGYKIENKHYVLDENQAPIVKEAFERYASGERIVNILEDFNRRHLKTSHGGAWNKNSFHSMFANVRYKGTYVFQDIIIENGIPRIVSDEVWEKANNKAQISRISGGKAYTKHEYLLSCKMYCSECNALFRGVSGTSKSGKKYHYYKCTCNDYPPIKQDEIENFVCEKLQESLDKETIENLINITMEQVDEYNRTHDNAEYLQNELNNIQKQIDNLVFALSNYFSDSVVDQLKKLEKDKKELTKDLENVEKNKIPLTRDMLEYYFEKLLIGDITDKSVCRQLVSIVCQKVLISKDKIEIEFNFEKIGYPLSKSVLIC